MAETSLHRWDMHWTIFPPTLGLILHVSGYSRPVSHLHQFHIQTSMKIQILAFYWWKLLKWLHQLTKVAQEASDTWCYEYIAHIGQYNKSQLVFVDESSTDCCMTYCSRGWAICGDHAI